MKFAIACLLALAAPSPVNWANQSVHLSSDRSLAKQSKYSRRLPILYWFNARGNDVECSSATSPEYGDQLAPQCQPRER